MNKQGKIRKVMKEFKNGTLKFSDGKKVTSRKQALAVAMSESEDYAEKANMMNSIQINNIEEAEDIIKATGTEDLFEKAKHQVGNIHPNGKWVWTEYAPGKFDWKSLKGKYHKKGGNANTGSGSSSINSNKQTNTTSKNNSKTTSDNKDSVKNDKNVKKENKKQNEILQANSTLKKMIEDSDFAVKFDSWYHEYDDEVSSEEAAEFENMTKHINYNVGKFFDWTEKEEAEEYKSKMEKRGYTVIDTAGDGSDSYIFYLFKPKKNAASKKTAPAADVSKKNDAKQKPAAKENDTKKTDANASEKDLGEKISKIKKLLPEPNGILVHK